MVGYMVHLFSVKIITSVHIYFAIKFNAHVNMRVFLLRHTVFAVSIMSGQILLKYQTMISNIHVVTSRKMDHLLHGVSSLMVLNNVLTFQRRNLYLGSLSKTI